MGWPKGKPRKKSSAERSGGEPRTATPSQEGPTPEHCARAAGPRTRDPAKRALSEIQKVLLKLEKARAHVADLEQQVSRMSQSLAGAVQAKGNQMPAQLRDLMDKTQEPEGTAGPLAGGDSMGAGRWL